MFSLRSHLEKEIRSNKLFKQGLVIKKLEQKYQTKFRQHTERQEILDEKSQKKKAFFEAIKRKKTLRCSEGLKLEGLENTQKVQNDD